MLDVDKLQRFLEKRIIEVAPLAFMRGRTLNDSFVILDEAQNTTAEQMKMFLTRLGFGSKAVVTGDVTQIDLPEGRARSGLLLVRGILEGIPGLQFVELTGRDVVRHRIVADIVDAYARHEQPGPGARPGRAGAGVAGRAVRRADPGRRRRHLPEGGRAPGAGPQRADRRRAQPPRRPRRAAPAGLRPRGRRRSVGDGEEGTGAHDPVPGARARPVRCRTPTG